jgi:hypothetical protein
MRKNKIEKTRKIEPIEWLSFKYFTLTRGNTYFAEPIDIDDMSTLIVAKLNEIIDEVNKR